VYNYFKLNSLAYIGNDQRTTRSELRVSGMRGDERGYVGCALAQGANAPGGIIILQDNTSPTSPWLQLRCGWISGASAWVDYNVTNPWHPGSGPFQRSSGTSTAARVQPYLYVWGRDETERLYTLEEQVSD